MLSSAVNQNGMVWKTSPAATELEQVSLKWLRKWYGLPENWFGLLYDTASIGSMHGIAAARHAADPESRTKGQRSPLTVYTSEQSHSSIEKGAIALGFGQEFVRRIPVDEEFRMKPDVLAAAIERDLRDGLKPCCVCATVGTTNTTSVDPVPQIADICEKHGIWLHVDSAYAGAFMVAKEFRWAFEGCDRADSLVTNPHKMLLTPMDCSAFFTRKPETLRQAFSLIPEYLRTEDHPRIVNLMDYGVPLGRRFRALKLWFVMRAYGREGMAQVMRSHVELAGIIKRAVDDDPRFERVAPMPFSVVCFRYKGTDEENKRIQDCVNATGDMFISGTVLKGKYTLRLAVGNLATRREHVERAWELISKAVE